jgi:uncharacterized protein YbaP (TraB family)
MLNRLLIFLIGIAFVGAVNAQENSLLWEITGNGLSQSSYLYGTFHSKDSRAHQFSDSMLVKLEGADLVMLEYIEDLSKGGVDMLEHVMMKDKKLEDLLSKKDFEFVKETVFGKMGLGGMFFNNMKPLFTSVSMVEFSARNEMPLTVDNFIKEKALTSNKRLVGLETFEEALTSMDQVSLKEQAEMLLDFVKNYDEQMQMGDKLIELYENQAIMKMHEFYTSLEDIPLSFDKDLVIDRNKKFVNGLVPHLKDNSVFCAVGALHLPGKTGLINTLRSKGYSVKPVFSEYSPTRVEIGRSSEWEYYSNDSLNFIMSFPGAPFYKDITLTNKEASKSIDLVNYYWVDSINGLKYSIKSGFLKDGLWTTEEVVESVIEVDALTKLNEKEELYFQETTTIVEFYVSAGVNRKSHIVIKDNVLYIISVEGSKQKLYSDLPYYFFGGTSFINVTEFGDIQNNEDNFTIDMVGSVANEDSDSLIDYQIYVIQNLDTVYTEQVSQSKFGISLPLGGKYTFGFKKEGYQQKHLVIDVVESGTAFDSMYGYEFPMNVTLVKGNENSPSTEVATIKYNPFSGYMDFKLREQLIKEIKSIDDLPPPPGWKGK